MNEEEYVEVPNRNYWRGQDIDSAGLKYRLDGREIKQGVIETLRGGVYRDQETGKPVYRDDCRLMNDEGIARVEMYLSAAVNKGAHLTRYKNEDRIMYQMRSLSKAYLRELVLNMKRWGPVDEEGNPTKVRNKYLVVQVVENAILQAMQRGYEGFEATLTGKSWLVNENVGAQPGAPAKRPGFIGRLFGRDGGGEQYG